MTTEVIRSRRDLQIGDLVEGHKIIAKKTIIPPNEKKKTFGIFDYTVEALKVEEPTPEPTAKKRGRKSKKDDPGFISIDMSTMTPVSGQPIVTFRFINGR